MSPRIIQAFKQINKPCKSCSQGPSKHSAVLGMPGLFSSFSPPSHKEDRALEQHAQPTGLRTETVPGPGWRVSGLEQGGLGRPFPPPLGFELATILPGPGPTHLAKPPGEKLEKTHTQWNGK
uniref:Uncharacterized protein n=1 Tax=Micrurus spixii TaxID=129469 RepID=A0A2D4LEK2_9SAUR